MREWCLCLFICVHFVCVFACLREQRTTLNCPVHEEDCLLCTNCTCSNSTLINCSCRSKGFASQKSKEEKVEEEVSIVVTDSVKDVSVCKKVEHETITKRVTHILSAG